MRIHIDREAMRIFRMLGVSAGAVRDRIQELRQNQYPDDMIVLPGEADEPDIYEIFVSGYWIGYSVDASSGETVITILSIEEN